MDYCSRFSRVVIIGLVIVFIQSCGSSDSPSDTASSPDTALAMNDPGAPFIDPVDASTLRSALVTGASASDLERFWRCDLSATDRVFAYNFFDSGLGMERDTSSSELSSDFTWQTTSATSMTTMFDGGQLSLTNIQFEGRDDMSLVVDNALTLSCERQLLVSETPETQPVATIEPMGDNQLSYGGVVYPLTEGFEARGRSRNARLESHKSSNFRVANAPFERIQLINNVAATFPITYYSAVRATTKLSADLYSPFVPEGTIGADSGTFTFEAQDNVEEPGPEVAGRSFFNDVSFGVDIDNDGKISNDDGEFIDVTGGTFSLTRINDRRSLVTFDLTLANGVSVTGSFENEFFILP